MMHFTNRSLERKLTLKIYEHSTSWRKRAYCWCTTQKMAEPKEEEVQEEACFIEKVWLHHNEKTLILPHFALLKSATVDAYTSCFSRHERTDKFISSFQPVSCSGSRALARGDLRLFSRSELAFRLSCVMHQAGARCWCREQCTAQVLSEEDKKIHWVNKGVYNELSYRRAPCESLLCN